MKPSELSKLLFILLGILFFGGLLVGSIISAILGFLEEQGAGLTFELKIATTAAVVFLFALTTYLLVKK
ncbi:MAG: hypothetical protein JW778_04105 [Candidatus Altiarchaeota archaeon]|nr:hypothetical protein [Candidatus Altiarchaeota archaeon]